MRPYLNKSGNSGIAAYETAEDSITVEFKDGAVYLYTEESAGRSAIKLMKLLAETGAGLNTYISANARKSYAERLSKQKP